MTQLLAQRDLEPRAIRVLLVCSESVTRAALRALIDAQMDTIVVGEVDRLDAAIEIIAADYPDVTVVDPDRYEEADVARLLRAGTTHTRIILLTGSPDSTPIFASLGNGAAGLVLKQQPPEVLIKAINKVYAGELWLDRAATARLIAEFSRAERPQRRDGGDDRATLLTNRERQVVALVGEGLRNSQIANRLCISEITVRNHLTSTFRKLEVGNRFQLVVYAYQHGLATLPPRLQAAATARTRHALQTPETEFSSERSEREL
jgi:DNA-binding NarL/FixJ family response regulator